MPMRRTLLLLTTLAFAPVALAQHPRLAEIKADAVRALDAPQPIASLIEASRGWETEFGRFWGFFNEPGQTETDGYGYGRLCEAPVRYVKTDDALAPWSYSVPLAGTMLPDFGAFYAVTNRQYSGEWGLDILWPEFEYEEVASLNDHLVLGEGEIPTGLTYDPFTDTMLMTTLYCDIDADGAYRQTLLYEIDLQTGVPTYLRDLHDPAASADGPNHGICLISMTWNGEGDIFGVDLLGNDLVRVNATTGELVERFESPLIGDVSYAQDSAYDEHTFTHYLMPYSRASEEEPFQTHIHACTSWGGCSPLGPLVGETSSVEPLAVAFPFFFHGTECVSSAESEAAASGVALSVYPNPATDAARVTVSLDRAEPLRIEVFDLLGRRVATLHDGPAAAFEGEVDTRALPSGVYVISIRTDGEAVTQRLVVTR